MIAKSNAPCAREKEWTYFSHRLYNLKCRKMIVGCHFTTLFHVVHLLFCKMKGNVSSHLRLWRKTRSDRDYYCKGVDPNRNYGHGWGTGGWWEQAPCSDNFKGPSAFSELETNNTRNFIKAHKDNIIFFNDIHSYKQEPVCWAFCAAAMISYLKKIRL